jgi:hypothetical protein
VIVAHVMGIPVEENILQLVPVGATVVAAVAIVGRTTLGRLRRRTKLLLGAVATHQDADVHVFADEPDEHGPQT